MVFVSQGIGVPGIGRRVALLSQIVVVLLIVKADMNADGSKGGGK